MNRLCTRCGAMVAQGAACGCGPSPRDVRRSVYDNPRWRTYTRPIVLQRDHHRCVNCGNVATIVDHVIAIELLLELGLDPFDPAECQSLCHHCSGKKDNPAATPSGGGGIVRA